MVRALQDIVLFARIINSQIILAREQINEVNELAKTPDGIDILLRKYKQGLELDGVYVGSQFRGICVQSTVPSDFFYAAQTALKRKGVDVEQLQREFATYH